MKFFGKYLISTVLLLALAWMWNCDLRAGAGFYCPDHLSISMEGADQPTAIAHSNSEIPDCHKNSSKNTKQSSHTDCSHCIELEWETANNFFPDAGQYSNIINWIVWNESISFQSFSNKTQDTRTYITVISKNPNLLSQNSTLQSNLRIRI